MAEYKVRHILTFEGTVEAPTEELVPQYFTELMFEDFEPTEHWDITQTTFSDE